MAQDSGKILPLFLNVDKPYISDDPKKAIGPDESPFLQGLSWDINANPEQGIGTNNPSGEGQNQFVLTPTRSNAPVPNVVMPPGYNKCCGSFESVNTQDLFYFNYNELKNHGIYLLDGNTGNWINVIIDQKLAFTDDQEGFIADVRVTLRYVRDKNGNIVEKHLLWTNGKKWQGWINVVAAIGSNGFDAGLYPYWTLQPPHFDREELLEWVVRPPMVKPIVEVIPNTTDDLGKINRLVDKAFQFAIADQYTDLRNTTLSPYSLPLIVRSEEYLNNPDSLPKNAKLTFPAGSPMTEKKMIFVRRAGTLNSIDSLSVWGDWILYDTIEKFVEPPTGQYWTRTNPWAAFNYDPVYNTIQYVFDNSKVGTIVSQADVSLLQTGMPQISQALTDVDDATLLINNRRNYDNLLQLTKDKLSAVVKEKKVNICSRPLRNIYLYAYIGQCGSNFLYTSQFGYTDGDDKTVRFGGVRMDATQGGSVDLDLDESKYFQLDFADKKGFRVYLKGTPYFADADWYIVKSDNSLEKIDNPYDLGNLDVLKNIQSIFEAGSYFIARFKLTVPAGRYIATLGRHNVSSAGDYRNTSTYIYGIANSRIKSNTPFSTGISLISLKPNSIGSYSKEMEIDCTSSDVDVWGNNADTFYVYCPYNHNIRGNGRYRFIEGYFQESTDIAIPVEEFPYRMNHSAVDDWGQFTDKNGFYWAFTKVANAQIVDIDMVPKVNCTMTSFTIPTSQTGIGWKVNSISYLASHNGGVVGDCNRIIFKGKITDLTGLIPYSNIAISIKDGATVYTRTDGTFILIVHNGKQALRTSNVYVNAGGNFLMTIQDCGQIPLSVFDESLSPCSNCNVRDYPLPLNLKVVIQQNSELSLKEGGKYSIGCVVADLAGRLTNVNPFSHLEVPTYLERDNINATFFQLIIDATLNFLAENPDIKWFSPYVSKNVIVRRYVQWVGDNLEYLDNNGNVVNDATTASFIKIGIDSLYNANITNNFSLLSTYQFAKEDRLRVYDDGDGNLFNTPTYGDPIDVQVLGTNYNQAAINAGLLPPSTNTVLPSVATAQSSTIGIIVRYDPRLDKLSGKTGFWIEVYTPTQENQVIPFFEVPGFYPVINGQISLFTGYASGMPTYVPLTSIDIEFWDTYYLNRIISGKYFNHPFESPNVTDNWGANITSGGRLGAENKQAKQVWLGGDVARSDAFMKNGQTNGLATFKDENRKNYGIYPFGEINAAITRRNIIAMICANDWFSVEYNMPYTRVGKDGSLVITNLDENLSLPNQKSGSGFGLEKRDIATVIVDDDYFFWMDRKNSAISKCDFRDSIDISQQVGSERGGIQSYLNEKLFQINLWEKTHDRKDSFDIVAGIDAERGNIYFTFRPRRNNSNNPNSYGNDRRNLYAKYQETFVYSIQYKGWLPCQNFTPEAYGRLRGANANVEFYSFAAGRPYYHNNTPNNSFLNFYGVQYEPSFIGVFNKTPSATKILQSISQDINGSSLYADMIYGTQPNSFSFIPGNRWVEKEKTLYAEVLRDMASYPPNDPEQLFRSMLFDGKRMFSPYFISRFIQDFPELGKYFQIAGIDYLFTNSFTTKP